MANSLESISLFKTEGSADKEYHLHLLEMTGGYGVQYANGRRGATMHPKFLNPEPLTREDAQTLYDSRKKSKLKDGYTEDVSGAAYVGTEDAGRVTGYLPQLLNEFDVDADEARYLNDDSFMLQEKKDGEHQLIIIRNGNVIGTNKDGLTIGIPVGREAEAKLLISEDGDTVIDGESIGDYFYAFDILKLNGHDMRGFGAESRYQALSALITVAQLDYIRVVETAFGKAEKIAMAQRLMEDNAEGYVLKDRNAKYVPGRPSSLGSMLKRKFKGMATVLVREVSATKASVAISMLNGDAHVDVGNVTDAKRTLKAGDLIEVVYLYANKGGSLIQPVFDKLRRDKTEADDVSTLKLKRIEQHIQTRPSGPRM